LPALCLRFVAPFYQRNMYLMIFFFVTSVQSSNVILGLNVMIRSDEKRMQYWENYGNNKLGSSNSVGDLINYVGQVTRFQSLFMDFVRSITTEINEKELSPYIINNIKKLMPEADVNTVFDFVKVIRRSVQEYSMVVLQCMSKLKHLPTKFKQLAKVAKTYEKMGKEVIPIPKLERFFNIKELKNNFRSLQYLSNEGLDLANYFFYMYQSIAPIPQYLKNFIQQKKKLSIELESEIKHREEILREKITEERNLKLQEEFKTMYEGYIKDLSSSSTNKECISATIVDTEKEHYNNLIIKAVAELQQHEENLKKVINPKLKKIEYNIERIKWEIERRKENKKELFEGNADIRASAERLIDAIDATQSFASVFIEQAVALNFLITFGLDNYHDELIFTMEDLLDEGSSLQVQKQYIQLIEDTIAEWPLLSFLADCNSLLTYPVMEKAEIQIMDQQINHNPALLPKLEL